MLKSYIFFMLQGCMQLHCMEHSSFSYQTELITFLSFLLQDL